MGCLKFYLWVISGGFAKIFPQTHIYLKLSPIPENPILIGTVERTGTPKTEKTAKNTQPRFHRSLQGHRSIGPIPIFQQSESSNRPYQNQREYESGEQCESLLLGSSWAEPDFRLRESSIPHGREFSLIEYEYEYDYAEGEEKAEEGAIWAVREEEFWLNRITVPCYNGVYGCLSINITQNMSLSCKKLKQLEMLKLWGTL